MTDAETIASWDKITDPFEALKLVIENEGFFGHDPYYGAIRAGVLAVVERVAAARAQAPAAPAAPQAQQDRIEALERVAEAARRVVSANAWNMGDPVGDLDDALALLDKKGEKP